MEIVSPSFEIMEPQISLDQIRVLKLLERYGRVCYQSSPGVYPESAAKFVRGIIDRGHESVIEHLIITVIVEVDRGVTHEWVRHRIAAYSQESTRYCNYGMRGVKFVRPPWMDASDPHWDDFCRDLQIMEALYLKWLDRWKAPEKARYFLPNGLRTQIVCTHNLREWRHIFKLRAFSPPAHPQMAEIMKPILFQFQQAMPVIFGDIKLEVDHVIDLGCVRNKTSA